MKERGEREEGERETGRRERKDFRCTMSDGRMYFDKSNGQYDNQNGDKPISKHNKEIINIYN